MKVSFALGALVSLASSVSAFQSFSGSNLYYAAGLSEEQQDTLFTGLEDAGIEVLRVWLDGEKSGSKGTSFASYPSLEGDSPGSYDDTVLKKLDDFMANAQCYGIKLIISFHSFNALKGKSDFYGKNYGTGSFYSNSEAISHYKKRIDHVMSHVNPNNEKTWAESSEYIFAFETQNEADHDNTDPNAPSVAWQCEIAGAIKKNLGDSKILVTTGGSSYLKVSAFDSYFSCDALDMISIHAYGVGDLTTDALAPYVQKAVKANKKLVMQEWGMCYYDSPKSPKGDRYDNSNNNNCFQSGASPLEPEARNKNIKKYANNIAQAGVPWMYWQILPNADPHYDIDFEVGIDDVNWEALKEAAQAARRVPSQFDFSEYLPSAGEYQPPAEGYQPPADEDKPDEDKPSAGEDKPDEDKPDEDKPSTGEYKKPSGGQYKKPSAGQYNKPSAGEDKPDEDKPSTGEYNKPSGGQYKKPSAGQYNKPSAGQYNKPSAGDY